MVLLTLNKNISDCELSCLGKADEDCTKREKVLEDPYGGFNILKEGDSEERTLENSIKSCLPRLLPSVPINDKNQPASNSGSTSKRKKSTVIVVAVQRKPYDGDEMSELCKYSL